MSAAHVDIALAVLGILLACIGGLVMIVYKALTADVDRHEVAIGGMPDKYATKSELKDLGDRIDTNLRDIKSELAAGNKTNQLLLSALLAEERRQGAGIHQGAGDA